MTGSILNRDSLEALVLYLPENPLPLAFRVLEHGLSRRLERIRVDAGVGCFVIGIVKWRQAIGSSSELTRIGGRCALIVVHVGRYMTS